MLLKMVILNKDYIDKENGKYIVKIAKDLLSNYYDANAIDNFLINKQDKLISGENIKNINGNSLLGSGDISISSGNNWEVINTSDFIKNSKEYTVRAFYNKYYYRINCSVETQFGIYGFIIFVNHKFISEKIPRTHYIGTWMEGYSSIFEWNKNTNYGTVNIEKA